MSQAIINFGNLHHNLQQWQKHLVRIKKPPQICAVLKNNAFGHGWQQCLSILYKDISYLALMHNEQFKVAHEKYPHLNLLRLRPAHPQETEQMLHSKIPVEEIICSVSHWKQLTSIAKKQRCSIRAHLMLMEGPNRMGINYDSLQNGDYQSCLACSEVEVVGIMSHFSHEDISICKLQFETFIKWSNQIILEHRQLFPDKKQPIRHIANSFAAFHFRESHLDMVRIGVGWYGHQSCLMKVNPSGLGLLPTLEVQTYVVLVRKILKGSPLGYNHLFRCLRDSYIATLPVGYGEGFARGSDAIPGLSVICGETECSVVGLVSSGITLIEVTHLIEADKEEQGIQKVMNSKVYLLNARMNAEYLGNKIGWLPHQVLCLLGGLAESQVKAE